MARMRIEWRGVDEVTPYESNPRHNDEAVEKVANSLREFGWQQPLVVDADGVIIVGHTRLKAAKSLGMDKVPVIVASNLTPAQCAAYRIADNSTGELATWDFDMLSVELDGLSVDFDMGDFGIEVEGDWFTERERNDTSRQEGNDEYNEFVEKFELKKTTDDCYTPDLVYDAVLGWVREEYGIPEGAKIVRPFYPNGDYEHEMYPRGCVVVDNPPFSILTEILRFYVGKGIRFFLFAPSLTLFTGRGLDITYVATGCDITYENGAKVNTGFVTNLDAENVIMTAPTLHDAVKLADKKNREEQAKPINIKYQYPSQVVTAAMLAGWAEMGVEFRVPKGEGVRISKLDAQEQYDKAIYGGGYLLSAKAAADAERAKADAERAKADAERAKALEAAKALGDDVEVEQDGSVVWRLSEREWKIVEGLA